MHSPEDGTTPPPSALDALAALELETARTLDPLAAVDASEAEATTALSVPSPVSEIPVAAFDPLESVAAETTEAVPTAATEVALHEPAAQPVAQKKVFSGRAILGHFKFLAHYLAVSAAVFAILLVGTNWNAYSSIVMNLANPGALKASGMEIAESFSKSKITVFASAESGSLDPEHNQEVAADLKKQLAADRVQVQEDPFSMKHLLPSKPSMEIGFDITPYENRLVIPKIGRNIPLVDVVTQGFDFDHMENIFMQELEKGVVRYPGSALPGENGNAFVFGHSSNYPWMKGSYNEVFALLDDLEFGDEIIVYYRQKKFVYVVREKKVVKPGDVKALDRDATKKELSLMTCWPVGTTLKRMLVFAELQPPTTP